MLRDADAAAAEGRGSLRALHLGFTRVGPAGVDALTQLRGLTALSFEGEDITSDCVQVRPNSLGWAFTHWRCHANRISWMLVTHPAGAATARNWARLCVPQRTAKGASWVECAGRAVQRLSVLTGLRHLGVSGTVASGDALVALTAALPALRHLEARNAQLTDANLRALPEVTSSSRLQRSRS